MGNIEIPTDIEKKIKPDLPTIRIIKPDEKRKTISMGRTSKAMAIGVPQDKIPDENHLNIGALSVPTSLEGLSQDFDEQASLPLGVGLITAPRKLVSSFVMKPISKSIPAIGGVAGGVLGFLGGLLLGGRGQEQDQQQESSVAPVVTPTQTTDVNPSISNLLELFLKIRNTQDTEVGGQDTNITLTGGHGGRVFYKSPITTTSNITNTTYNTSNIQNTITNTLQKTVTSAISYQGQEATQEQGLDLLTIALIGGIAFLIMKE